MPEMYKEDASDVLAAIPFRKVSHMQEAGKPHDEVCHLEMCVEALQVSFLRREEVQKPVVQTCFTQDAHQVVDALSGQVVAEEGRHPMQHQALGHHGGH